MIKVVWLCHFSNSEIRKSLPLSKRINYIDFAPWISSLLRIFELNKEIELHVIAPHNGLKRMTFSFKKKNIHYHFFKPDLPFIHKQWPLYFPVHRWTKYFMNRTLINRFIKEIRPDIINLHGAECSYFSIAVLDITEIPVYVCIQGIYSNNLRFSKYIEPDKLRVEIERRIHKRCRYFGIFSPFFQDLIKRDNMHPIFLKQSYVLPLQLPKDLVFQEKKYDFVFFAWVSEVKGIDKIIHAVSLIKKLKKDVSLLIIGGVVREYWEKLESQIHDLELKENVTYVGHMKTLKDVYEIVTSARISVISPKFDNMPSTIIESAFLGLPVVSSEVGGISYLNKNGETVLLSKYGDIEKLASNMLRLLQNKSLSDELAMRCRDFIEQEFNEKLMVNRYIKQYHNIISHFKNNTKIDEDLLFNLEEYR